MGELIRCGEVIIRYFVFKINSLHYQSCVTFTINCTWGRFWQKIKMAQRRSTMGGKIFAIKEATIYNKHTHTRTHFFYRHTNMSEGHKAKAIKWANILFPSSCACGRLLFFFFFFSLFLFLFRYYKHSQEKWMDGWLLYVWFGIYGCRV